MGGRFSKLEDKKFGKLLVIEKVRKSQKGVVFYRCVCDCGNEKIVPSYSLNNGHVRSCGCLQKESRACPERGEAGFRALLRAYKANAKARNIPWNLADEEVKELTARDCFYCGSIPARTSKGSSVDNFGDYMYNGLDRVDSEKGYFRGNVVPCCYTCNARKSNFSIEDMIKSLEFLGYKVIRCDDVL